MKFLTASKLLVLPFLASMNAVQAVEKDDASSVVQKKFSFLKDHRALQEQKFNKLKTVINEKARTRELSADTQKLLECVLASNIPEQVEYPTWSFKMKGPDPYTLIQAPCEEGFKTYTQSYVFCEDDTAHLGGLLVKQNFCLKDDDACPGSPLAMITAIIDAFDELENEEGFDSEVDYSALKDEYSNDKCTYPQCMQKALFEYTYNTETADPLWPYSCDNMGGTCEVDCEDNSDYACVPGLCYSNKDYDPSSVMKDVGNAADFHPAVGHENRQLKATKSPKGTKTPKAGKGKCTCKIPIPKLTNEKQKCFVFGGC